MKSKNSCFTPMFHFAPLIFTSITAITILAQSGLGYSADAKGWEEIPMAGDTMCANGSPYKFYVRKGTSGKLVVDFMGGPTCWNAETCKDGSPSYSGEIPDILGRWIPEAAGIYDHSRADNPFRDDTHVLLPYCTDDIHWGSSDNTYTTTNSQKPETFTRHHRGAINAKAAIDYTFQNLASHPSQIVVTGCSAGSYGSIWWTPYIRRLQPKTKMIQFGDSGAGILTTKFRNEGFPVWHIEQNAPSWIPALDPAQHDLTTIRTSDLYHAVASADPDLTLGEFSTINDVIQKWFYRTMGGDPAQWTDLMRAEFQDAANKSSNYSYFIGPYDGHCILPYNTFYGEPNKDKTSIGFTDWLQKLTQGEKPSNENCDQCEVDHLSK